MFVLLYRTTDLLTHAACHIRLTARRVMGKKKKKKQTKEEEEEEDFNAMLKEFKQDDAKEGRHATEPPLGPVCTQTFHFLFAREL